MKSTKKNKNKNKAKLATRINDKIEIRGDEHQWIVVIKTAPNQDIKHTTKWYYPDLEMCFKSIFDYLVKKRVANGKDKTTEEIKNIILETKQEIMDILEPYRFVCPKLKDGRSSEKGGKRAQTTNHDSHPLPKK